MVFRAESFHGVRPKKTKKKKAPRYATGGRGVNVATNIGGANLKNNNSGAGGYSGPLWGDMADRDPLDRFLTPKERNARRNANAAPQRVARQATMRPKRNGGGGGGGNGGGGSGLPGPQGTEVLDQLVQSMLTDAASQSFDYESALRQSQNAIRQAYGAEIGAIRSNNRAARRDTAKGRKEIERMYSGLAASYGQQANNAVARGNNEAKAQQNLATQANKTIAANNRSTTKEESQMLKDLGLQSTADEIIAPDFEKLRQTTAENTTRGARKASGARSAGQNDATFFRQGGQGARFEGTNRSADLLSSLQDYIRQNRNQVGVIKGKRAQDLATNKQAVMSSAAEAESKADSEMWDRMMQVTQLKASIGDTNFDNALAAQKFRYTQTKDRRDFKADQNAAAAKNRNSFLPESLQQAMGVVQTNNPNQPRKVTSILQSLFNSRQYRDGSVSRVEGKGANAKNVSHKLTPAEAANMAERAARAAGLSQKDINIARLAAWASVEK